LSACDWSDSGSTSKASAGGDEGTPKRGGRLSAGMVGGGSGETFNPERGSDTMLNIVRQQTHFDRLVSGIVDPLHPTPALALEWTSNADASVWQFKLRPDVTWHDGKPFTADDVIYSLKFQSAPKHWSSSKMKDIRHDEIKKIDKLTLEVPLKQGNTRFPYNIAEIVQDGAKDWSNPVGTGAFMLKSFTPGRSSLSARNPNYWDEGKPYVDELELVSIDDDSARVNALLAGDVNAIGNLPYPLGRKYENSSEIRLMKAGSTSPNLVYMAVDIKPFDDVRVRNAIKLLADRQELIDGALSGFGEIANDMFGMGLPFYPDTDVVPQRERDVEQARSLLKQAGYDNDLRLELKTAPSDPGLVEAATLLKTQAKDAGVTIDVKRVDPAAYYDPALLYLKLPWGLGTWTGIAIADLYTSALVRTAPYNETHWKDPAFDKLVYDAIATVDEKQATEKWLEISKIQFEKGGYLTWGMMSRLDASAPNIKGWKLSATTSLGGGRGLANAWIA
jgi:peptide/nickel transport system substrate-binding protein